MSQSLTKNQKLVLESLKSASKPQTAYSLLGQLNEHGLKAPPQVYRALEKLQKLGLIHKLESINSYVDSHRSLIEGDDDAELPMPGRQPTVIKLYVRQQTAAEPVAVTAMLQDTTQAHPQG